MAFSFDNIPGGVTKTFDTVKTTPGLWHLGVETAKKYGITSYETLTNILFFCKYPLWQGYELETLSLSLVTEWHEIENQMKKLTGTPIIPPRGSGPRWLDYAQQQEAAWNEVARNGQSDEDVSQDEAYFKASPYYQGSLHQDGDTPSVDSARKYKGWCAAFVNWCLHNAGYSHTGSAGDGTFIRRSKWKFKALKEPKKGCVIVTSSGSDSDNPNHVAFLWRQNGLPKDPGGHVCLSDSSNRRVFLLGGNQSGIVKQSMYDNRKLLAAKDSQGNYSPYLWPLQGPATCNIQSVHSEQGHHCGNTL